MKCRRLIICFGLLLSVFLSLSLSSDTFATELSSNTVSSPVDWDSVFPNCDSSCFNGPRYLVVSTDSSSFSVRFRIRLNGSTTSSFYFSNTISGYSIYLLPFNDSSSNGFWFHSNNAFSSPVSFILYDSPPSFSDSSPTGNLDITENGEYDVTDYATATVNVEAEVIYGDYHDDLVAINNSILICAAVCLVIYFFYCIYRMIIRNSGVK